MAACILYAVSFLALPAHSATDGWVVSWGTSKSAAQRQAELTLLGYTEQRYYSLSNISWVKPVAETVTTTDSRFTPNNVGQYFAAVTPNDPQFTNALTADDLALQYINLPTAWGLNQGSSSVRIGILDSGIDTDHPDLKNKIDTAVSFATGNTNPGDSIGHGTSTASLAAAEANNGVGVAGVCWNCRIVSAKAGDAAPTTAAVAEGLRWMAQQSNVKIINMSFGLADDAVLSTAISYANDQGILLIAATGNDGANAAGYPAKYDQVMGVGAIDPTTGTRAAFSNYKDGLDLVAPGVDMFGDSVDASNVSIGNGTSFAAPIVAGVAGLIWSENPGLTRDEVKSRLLSSAKDLNTSGYDDQTGVGSVDAAAALRTAAFQVSGGKDVINYPNPYRVREGGTVTIRPPQDVGVLTVKLYSMDGRLLRTLSGTNEVQWDGKTVGGQIVPAGVYLFQASSTNLRDEGRITVIDW